MIEVMWLISFFVIGALFGSFYNVVGLRIPNNESIVFPSSHCTRCGHELKWYELIPIFSYIFLRGKCRNCKEKISIMYPLIELFTAITFTVSYYSFGFSYELVYSLIIVSLMVIVIVSDINYMIIPDSFIVVPAILIIIFKFIHLGVIDGFVSIGYGVISFLILYIIMLIGNKVFKKECLGGADIKLFFVVGLLFPPFISMLVLVIACFIALPVSLIILFKNRENIIPFGPFIVISTLLVYFTKIDFQKIMDFLTNL